MVNKSEVLAVLSGFLGSIRPTREEYDALEDSVLESKFIIRIFGSWTRFLKLLADDVEPIMVKKDTSSNVISTTSKTPVAPTVAVKPPVSEVANVKKA